jgi:molecular chaperone DnaK
VFDLGGGTFDVTIIVIDGNSIRVRSTAGDHQLGGKDWDDRLIDHVAKAFQKEFGINPLEDAFASHELRGRCVSAKLTLTMRPEVKLDFRYQGRPLRITVTRNEFENLTADLLSRTEEMTRFALQEAKFNIDDIDTVLLVGGSTRMPMVRSRIREIFKKEPSTEINPDECVALGAALTAALAAAHKQGQKSPIDIKTHDVSGHSLGMVVYKNGELFNTPIIRRNTPIPCEKTKEHFTTTHPGQSMIDLWLVQGERKEPLACNVLGHFEFFGIPPRPAGQSQIAVTYRYNENGIVEVEATDMVTGKLLSHRLSADRYNLHDLQKGKIPAHMAVIVDCSGSMFGEPMEAARIAIRRFTEQLLKPYRTMAIFTHPGSAKPMVASSNPNDIYPVLGNLIPIGDSGLQRALLIARKSLKDRGGLYIVISDGKLENQEGILKECDRIRRQGGRIFCIGVGPAVEKDFLTQLCATEKDYFDAYEAVDISHALVNIVTDIS